MKKGFLILLCCSLGAVSTIFAQSLGETAIKEILSNNFNEQLPKVLGNGKLMEGLNLAQLKIRPGYIKIKGQTKWNLKLGKHSEPIRFKGLISTRFKSFGKPDLKVNLPGDRFLFFRKYQRLSDLVNLKKLVEGKGK